MKDVHGVLIGSALATALTGLYFWRRYQKSISEWKIVAEVDKLIVHPIKSCRGIHVDSFTVETKGIYLDGTAIGDRSFMVTHENGRFATIRPFPRMVLINPTAIDGNTLRLDAPDMDPIEVKIPDQRNAKTAGFKVFGDTCFGVDCGDEVAEWLHKYMKVKNTRLVYHSRRLPSRKITRMLEFGRFGVYAKEPIEAMFQDDAPVNVMSQASLDCLNTKLDQDHQVDENYFRPNLVLKGCDAFAEDSWKRIRVGSAEFEFVKHSTRCKATTVNPETGVMDVDRNTLKSLSSFRLCKAEEKPFYGDSPKIAVDLVVVRPGKVKVGDTVYLYTGGV